MTETTEPAKTSGINEFVAMLGRFSFGTEYMFDFMVNMLTAFDPGEHTEGDTVYSRIDNGWMPLIQEERMWVLTNPTKEFNSKVPSIVLSTVAWVSVLDALVVKLYQSNVDMEFILEEINCLRAAAINHLRSQISANDFKEIEKLF